MARVIIDGFNVINAVLLRGRSRDAWWSEPNRRALVDWLRDGGLVCTVVFDGDRADVEQDAGVEVRYVADADTWIVENAVVGDNIVTRDRRLADRLRSRGIHSRSPTWLERELGAFRSR